jgi:hypothetical protein
MGPPILICFRNNPDALATDGGGRCAGPTNSTASSYSIRPPPRYPSLVAPLSLHLYIARSPGLLSDGENRSRQLRGSEPAQELSRFSAVVASLSATLRRSRAARCLGGSWLNAHRCTSTADPVLSAASPYGLGAARARGAAACAAAGPIPLRRQSPLPARGPTAFASRTHPAA